ncbi:MAG TPA: hypothetical protein VK123_08050 [Candidatus Limnocylindrales bacterium]|nr:hypothetical protein [Candidatus Limnocylindrales bacterium]
MVVGCGLFDTRDPKLPTTPTAPCANYTEPDSLVLNIRVHYGQLSVASCYNPMLDSLFLFHPDPVDSSVNPTPFLKVWNQQVEGRVATNIAADSVAMFQTFFDGTYQSPIVDPGPPRRETRFYNYHILFTRIGRFAAIRYQGRAEITFEQETGTLWRIRYWTDHADTSGYPTWGRLRADHRVGF